jgi:ATP-dependent RNA helicase DBP3
VVEVIDQAGKDRRLCELLKKYHDRKNRIIIFVLYKKEADRVNAVVEKAGFSVLAIHGDRSQEQRSAAVEKFKAGSVPLLIATDVAAR